VRLCVCGGGGGGGVVCHLPILHVALLPYACRALTKPIYMFGSAAARHRDKLSHVDTCDWVSAAFVCSC
jgi:hypothetical protein